MPLIDARLHVTDPSGRFLVPKANIIGKAAHHSVTGGSFFLAGEITQVDEINHIKMIDEYHVSIGFGGFAYHACAFASGRAYKTSSFPGARAHVASRNHELLGWVLIGNYVDQLPSAGGMAAAAECERAFDAYLGREVPLKGHRDWALPGHGTACPGRVRERLSTIKNLARKEDDMTPDEVKRIVAAETTTLRRDVERLEGELGGVVGSIKNRNALIAAAGDSNPARVARNADRLVD